MSWRDDMDEKMTRRGNKPTHAEIMRELRSEWEQFKHVKLVAEREMEVRKRRFEEIQQDGLDKMGEKFLNEHQILWDTTEE